MKVSLINYTGIGHPASAERFAAAQLIFTKSTRLQMQPSLFNEILMDWPWKKMLAELEYISNTIPSSWEFCDYTFLIEGVSRAFTHQFVRSRHWSFAQQTMRVLDVSEGKGWDYLTGPTIANDEQLAHIYSEGMIGADIVYKTLVAGGAAIEDARGALPTNILTNMVGKANLRGVCELVRKRSSSRTQGEYREVLQGMKYAVTEVHPWAELFIARDFDLAAHQLECMLIAVLPPGQQRTDAIKLIDQMRGSK